MSDSRVRRPGRSAKRSLSFSGLFCFSASRTLDEADRNAAGVASRRSKAVRMPALKAGAAAPQEVRTPPSVALETYLGRERMGGDAQLASTTVATAGESGSELRSPRGDGRVGASPAVGCRAESEASGPTGESVLYDPSESTSLSGPHTPDGLQQHANQSITLTPEGTSTGGSLDEAGPSASARAHSMSVATPPESPALGEHSQLALGRKLTVLRTLPAVVVLGNDPDSPSPSSSGSGDVQRRISHIVAGHHVHFTKIKRQMGNINGEGLGLSVGREGGGAVQWCLPVMHRWQSYLGDAQAGLKKQEPHLSIPSLSSAAPPEDLLTLMARKVFVRQNCAFNQVRAGGRAQGGYFEGLCAAPAFWQAVRSVFAWAECWCQKHGWRTVQKNDCLSTTRHSPPTIHPLYSQQVNSVGELSDLAAENSMPTPSSGLPAAGVARGAPAATPAPCTPVVPVEALALDVSAFSSPCLPPIRTRVPVERRSSLPLL